MGSGRFRGFGRILGPWCLLGLLGNQPTAVAEPLNIMGTGTKNGPVEMVETAPQGLDLECESHHFQFSFQGEDWGFRTRDAYWMMWLTMRSYVTRLESTRQEMARVGYTKFVPFFRGHTDTEGYVASNGSHAVIVFRGSNSLIDWIGNFLFYQVDGEALGLPGKVHGGFARNLADVWPDVMQALEQVTDGTRQPLFVTGHSLGGALAGLTALRLARLSYDVAGVYTFAAPRFGNRVLTSEMRSRLSGRYFRIINSEDLVPRLPPTAEGAEDFGQMVPERMREWLVGDLLGGLDYGHAGDLLWFDDQRKPRFLGEQDEEEDSQFWSRVASLVGDLGLPNAVRTISQRQGLMHSEKSYACRLQEMYRVIAGPGGGH